VSPPSAAARPLVRVGPGPVVAALAQRHADLGLSARALEVEALLHLPRLADRTGAVEADAADEEVARLGTRLRSFHEPVEGLLRPPEAAVSVAELRFGDVGESLAATIMRHLHYLHSPRHGSVHLANYTPGDRIVAAVSLSGLDLGTIAAALPAGLLAEEALVVSRVFAFDWAPRNTISHLLAQIERWLRQMRPEIRFLLTYVNPNLGFDGASYRAANWSLFGQEIGTRYGYLDGDYISDREIELLSGAMRRRVVYSVMPLEPLAIYGRFLQRHDRRREISPSVLPRAEHFDARS